MLLILMTTTAALAVAPQPEPPIQVFVDGKLLDLAETSVLEGKCVLIPLRSIFEALDAEVSWDNQKQSITVIKGTTTLYMQIGNKTALKNGVPLAMDVPPKVSGGRTFVPLRFVGEALGYAVSWDGKNRRIYISSNNTNSNSEITGENLLKGLPADPSNLTAIGFSGDSIKLSWQDNSDNETGFGIERKGLDGDWIKVVFTDPCSTSYIDSGQVHGCPVIPLEPGVEYTYRVRAVNGVTGSGYSNEASAMTLTNNDNIHLPPAAPSKLTAKALTGNSIILSWQDNSTNETCFIIERKNNSHKMPDYIVVKADSTTYTDKDVQMGVVYTYRILAANEDLKSEYSNKVSCSITSITVPPVIIHPIN